jgi:hypothetical protein
VLPRKYAGPSFDEDPEILVPKTVWEALVVARPAEPGVEALQSSSWIP